MEEWLYCNICHKAPSSGCSFLLTSCGHFLCQSCNNEAVLDKCRVCNASCKIIPLSQMQDKEKVYFISPAESIKKYLMQVLQVLEFQKIQRCKHFTYHKQKISRLELTCKQMANKIEELERENVALRGENAGLKKSLHVSTRASPTMYGISMTAAGNRNRTFTQCAMPAAGVSSQHGRNTFKSPLCPPTKRSFQNTPEVNSGNKATWIKPLPIAFVTPPQTPAGSSRITMRNPRSQSNTVQQRQLQNQSSIYRPVINPGSGRFFEWKSSLVTGNGSQCSTVKNSPCPSDYQTPLASPSTRQMMPSTRQMMPSTKQMMPSTKQMTHAMPSSRFTGCTSK